MVANTHWMYQGRQYHQWFGHGTAAKEVEEGRSPSGLFDPVSIGQRIDYAVGHVIGEATQSERSRWESRLSGTARDSLKTAIGAWYGARALSREKFRQRLLDPYSSDETVDRLREASEGIVDA